MQEQMVTITVDGEEVEARLGSNLLDVLRGLNLDIPTLCHDDRLTPYGGCRLCVVQRKDGRGGMIPTCSTPVQRGMIIDTETESVIEARRRNLQMLMLNHRMECPVCDRNGDCRFQELIYLYGVPEKQLPFELIRRPVDVSSPFILRDPEKCILCGKCVRLCDEIQGVGEIGLVHRGLEATVTTLLERPLDCEFCGQCVNACPVGALIVKPFISGIPAWMRERRDSACSWCSCGCELEAEVYEGKIVRMTSRPGSDPNDGTLCVKGWLGWDLLNNPDRLTRPLVRKEDRLQEASWPEALDAVAAGFARAREKDLPVAAVATSRLTNEDALLLRHFVREQLGSDLVGLGPAGGVRALQTGVAPVFGAPRSTLTLSELQEVDFVPVVRADPGRTHPLLKLELVRRHRQRGLPFAMAAAFTGGLERHAEPFLRLQPGSETALLAFLSRELAARGLLDDSLDGFDAWLESLSPWTVEHTAEVTGVSEALLKELTEKIAQAEKLGVVVPTGHGIPGDEGETTRAAASLVAALGEAAGLLVLGEKTNLQGCLDAGLAQSSPEDILDVACQSKLGCLYLLGQDPAGSWPRSMPGREAIEKTDFLVVQDAFLTESARAADVVLPVAILIERDGLGTGPDGALRHYRRIVDPPEGVLQDGEIIRAIAAKMELELPGKEALQNEETPKIDPHPVSLSPLSLDTTPRLREAFYLDASPQLFHSGATTTHSARLRELSPDIFVRVAPEDAQAAGLENGDTVRIIGEGREMLLRARLDHRIAPGTLAVPWKTRDDGASRFITHEGEVVSVRMRRS